MTRSTRAVTRPATVEDLDRFIDVRLRALGDSPFAFGSTLERERQFERLSRHRREISDAAGPLHPRDAYAVGAPGEG